VGATVVRGYSGFGFSLPTITALSLALAPARIVPSIFMLEVAASLPLLIGVWFGNHGFKGADPAAFRRWVLRLLIELAVLAAGQGATGLAG